MYWKGPFQVRCSCGWKTVKKNPVAAQFAGEAHIPHCRLYAEQMRIAAKEYEPQDGVVTCHACKKRRKLLTMHCEHCDSPLKGFGPVVFNRTNETQTQQEDRTMPDFSKQHKSNSKGDDNGGFTSRKFLKGTDLPRGGKIVKARVDDFRDAPRNMKYSQYLLDITIGKTQFTIGIKDDNDTKLERAISVLGPKTDRWKGKTLQLHNDIWDSPTGKVSVVRIVGK